jgi:phosphatidate cytidylyltransferase
VTGDLARRLATAAVALPLLVAVVFLAPPAAWIAFVGAAALLGAWEFFALLAGRGLRPLRVPGLLLAAAVYLPIAVVRWDGPPPWPAALLALLAAGLSRAGDMAAALPAVAGTGLGALYAGGLAGTIGALRLIDPVSDGPRRVLMLCAIIMGADTAAYFTGRLVGRRKLAPAISPGKTIEGFLGGLVGGVAAAFAVRGAGWIPGAHAFALGATVAALGTVGDLVESLFKRWAQVKDSGTLFPGHGGMLDRLDSLLFGAPVLYYYVLYAR